MITSVLILGNPADPQVRRVSTCIMEAGEYCLVFNAPGFPGEGTLTLTEEGAPCLDGAILPTPRVVYIRGLGCHPLIPGAEEDLTERPRGWIVQCDEKRGFLEAFLLILERRGARLVNPLHANEQHSRKPWQLALLRSAGLPIPRSLATNDPEAVFAFREEVKQVVYKPISGGATVRMLAEEDLTSDRLSALELAPVLFQEYIHGVSVRAYVIDGEVVAAAELHSEEIDYRRGEEAVNPTRLTLEETNMAVAAAKACDMVFSGVDLIRGAAGTVILECNPSPMFAVFGEKTGLDVGSALARFLLR